MSILPNIVHVALEKGLTVDEKTLGKDEVRFICPWCGDETNKGRRRRKYHLSLNPNPGKNIYKCWYCHENGGVVDFIAKLEGRTAEDVLDGIKKEKGISTKKRPPRHPFETLSYNQLKLIGYDPDIRGRMIEFRKVDPYLARKKCDEIWEDWQAFQEQEKRKAFKRLLAGIKTGKYAEAIQDIEERSKNIGRDLLPDVFHIYGRPNPPEWSVAARQLIDRIAKLTPSETKAVLDVFKEIAISVEDKSLKMPNRRAKKAVTR